VLGEFFPHFFGLRAIFIRVNEEITAFINFIDNVIGGSIDVGKTVRSEFFY
jgi:hypothetical protein